MAWLRTKPGAAYVWLRMTIYRVRVAQVGWNLLTLRNA